MLTVFLKDKEYSHRNIHDLQAAIAWLFDYYILNEHVVYYAEFINRNGIEYWLVEDGELTIREITRIE
jgi:hypothetical protein